MRTFFLFLLVFNEFCIALDLFSFDFAFAT